MAILRKPRNKILAAFLIFQKNGCVTLITDRTGTSHIIGQNLLAKFGVTQTVNAKFCEFFFVKGPEAPSTGLGDNL